MWSFMKVVSDHGGLSSLWSLFIVVSHQGALFIVVFLQGGLSSWWSLIWVVVSHQGFLCIITLLPMACRVDQTWKRSGKCCCISRTTTLAARSPVEWLPPLKLRKLPVQQNSVSVDHHNLSRPSSSQQTVVISADCCHLGRLSSSR